MNVFCGCLVVFVSVFLRYGIDMRLVVFFNGFNLWLCVAIVSTLQARITR
ncbi:hypothetical protein KVK73_01140 [Helicobacter pylori]|nr:hypothetical protein KVK73_01140 [Helicobacter pylori]